jgi:hypothetical protein
MPFIAIIELLELNGAAVILRSLSAKLIATLASLAPLLELCSGMQPIHIAREPLGHRAVELTA